MHKNRQNPEHTKNICLSLQTALRQVEPRGLDARQQQDTTECQNCLLNAPRRQKQSRSTRVSATQHSLLQRPHYNSNKQTIKSWISCQTFCCRRDPGIWSQGVCSALCTCSETDLVARLPSCICSTWWLQTLPENCSRRQLTCAAVPEKVLASWPCRLVFR